MVPVVKFTWIAQKAEITLRGLVQTAQATAETLGQGATRVVLVQTTQNKTSNLCPPAFYQLFNLRDSLL